MTVTKKSRLADKSQTASRLHKREEDRMNIAVTLQKRGCPSYLRRASWRTRQAASALVSPNDKWFFRWPWESSNKTVIVEYLACDSCMFYVY